VRLELKLGTQNFTFFFLYFPPYKSIDKDCVEFFNRLDPIIAHEDIVVLGDMNARLGNENTDVDSRNSKDLKTNPRGQLILNKLRWLGLRIANGGLNGDVEGESHLYTETVNVLVQLTFVFIEG